MNSVKPLLTIETVNYRFLQRIESHKLVSVADCSQLHCAKSRQMYSHFSRHDLQLLAHNCGTAFKFQFSWGKTDISFDQFTRLHKKNFVWVLNCTFNFSYLLFSKIINVTAVKRKSYPKTALNVMQCTTTTINFSQIRITKMLKITYNWCKKNNTQKLQEYKHNNTE